MGVVSRHQVSWGL